MIKFKTKDFEEFKAYAECLKQAFWATVETDVNEATKELRAVTIKFDDTSKRIIFSNDVASPNCVLAHKPEYSQKYFEVSNLSELREILVKETVPMFKQWVLDSNNKHIMMDSEFSDAEIYQNKVMLICMALQQFEILYIKHCRKFNLKK